MSQIAELNNLMPTDLDKLTVEYEAIFGKEDFTPNPTIAQSSDFQCGAIANELEYAKGFIDYITRTNSIDNFYGEYLEKILYFFTGLTRVGDESDADLRNRFRALVIRQNNPSWITTWMIRDVFKYYFSQDIIYVIENFTLDNFIYDGSFEINPAANWGTGQSGSSTVTWDTTQMFDGGTCAKLSVDGSGSDVYISQVMNAMAADTYVLSFFQKDDRAYAGPTLFKVVIQRSIDSYYYNFDTMGWQAGEAHLVVNRNAGTRYECVQAFVNIPVGMAGYNVTVKFENIGGTSTPYVFYIDDVQFGTMLPNPSVKVTLINVGGAGDFMSLWEGSGDPIPGLDYDFASYLGQCYIGGWGGLNTLQYYEALLQIIKPFGVQSLVEVINRAEV